MGGWDFDLAIGKKSEAFFRLVSNKNAPQFVSCQKILPIFDEPKNKYMIKKFIK